jgi:arylformamidase
VDEPARAIGSWMTRRRVLGGALLATLGTAIGGGRALAQQLQTHRAPGVVPKAKGPLVFLDYDQEELDDAYTQSLWAPNQAELRKRNAQKGEQAVARLGPPRRLAYGATESMKLDLYSTKRPHAPINVFIHRGAWQAGSAADAAYQSEMFVDAGAHFIALDFNNVIETKGDLLILADQVRRGVAWVYRNARSFGGDPDRLYVSGHSSGAHLTAVVLTTEWQRDFALPGTIIRGAMCASGMYDLRPVSLSARRRYVNFTPQTIDALSPQEHLDALTVPVIVAHGTLETPEFQRQSREFAAAVKAAGKVADLIVLDGYNHFEVAESLGNPYGPLGRAVLRQMRLSPVRRTGPHARTSRVGPSAPSHV